MQLLIATTLAAAGCQGESSACPPNPDLEGDPFTLEEDLVESDVQTLLDEHGQVDPTMLACDDVCRSRHYDPIDPKHITSIEACTLMIDGEFTGDPDAIVGTLQCEGHDSGYVCTGGRRPIGHIEHQLSSRGLPAFLAHGARLEAASVLAFSQLADRLQAWGAPGTLVDRCRKAAVEEAQHAALLGALARAQQRNAPSALNLPGAREAARFAAGLASM